MLNINSKLGSCLVFLSVLAALQRIPQTTDLVVPDETGVLSAFRNLFL